MLNILKLEMDEKWKEITEMLFSHLKGLNSETSPHVNKQQKVRGTKNADTFN